ncbi:hypothetical protein L3X38_004006 [Prunus dulcis]|uniref:Uncharacterized protein n=1 Tax=Prunus dulcis TaxID=3755 RepID=A0AAD4ZN28_PRUDU|nr:hypothetical protein L3X38_004006 [Prunus dulcis]
MEYPFSPKEKGSDHWASSRAQVENLGSLDVGTRNSISEDMFNNISELMNFDTYAGWCSPAAMDQISASFGVPSCPSVTYAPLDALNFAEQNGEALPGTEGGETFNVGGSSFSCEDKIVFQQMDTPQFGVSTDSHDANDLAAKLNNESSGGGILAQLWVPVKYGDHYLLSTCEQPYLLDHILAGYREVSRTFTFPAEEKQGSILGLPGRVFVSKVPEWTSDFFNFDSEMSCCAVLELVSTKEKPNFDTEMEIVWQCTTGCEFEDHGASSTSSPVPLNEPKSCFN